MIKFQKGTVSTYCARAECRAPTRRGGFPATQREVGHFVVAWCSCTPIYLSTIYTTLSDLQITCRGNLESLNFACTSLCEEIIGFSVLCNYKLYKKHLYLLSSFLFCVTLYPAYSRICRENQVLRYSVSFKTLTFSISIKFWRHRVLSSGTQRRALPPYVTKPLNNQRQPVAG